LGRAENSLVGEQALGCFLRYDSLDQLVVLMDNLTLKSFTEKAMKLYGMQHSRSFRVAWVLEEAGLAYDYEKIDLMKGQGNSPEFLAVNPGGKVPALDDDGFVLTESSAICSYVARKVPEKQLIPDANNQLCALYDQWCMFAMAELEQPLWAISRHTFVYEESRRAPAIIPSAKEEWSIALALVSQALEGKQYIVNEAFSVADILIVQSFMWAEAIQLDLEHDNLRAYKANLMKRPAFIQAMAVEAEKGAC